MSRTRFAGIALLICFSTASSLATAAVSITKEHCVHGDRLHKAAAKGDIKFLQACLKAETPIDAVEGNGWTALHAAAFSGQIAAVDLLLKSGAKTDVKDKNGNTAMALAERQKHAAAATLISTSVAKSNTADASAISDEKKEKLAEAVRWELNNYGPASSNDELDYQVSEVVSVVKGDASDSGTSYTITVKFNTGIFHSGSDIVTYKSTVLENSDGNLSVAGYDSTDD